jgi:hypothetical protein
LRLPSVPFLSGEFDGGQILNICSFRTYPEQQTVIRFFTLKELKARVIHTELESAYGPEAPALPTVKKWRRRFHQGRTDLFDDPRSGRSFAGAIGCMLEERSFNSRKVFYPHAQIGKATCLWILHHELGLKRFHLLCVPHALSINQKNKRVSYSKLFLTALMEQKTSGFQHIITGDDSWFSIYPPVIRPGRRRVMSFL